MIAWLQDVWRQLIGRFRRRPLLSGPVDPELRDVFLSELEDLDASMREAMTRWQQDPRDAVALKMLRRGFHTIKGSAGLIGADALAEFCRALEQMAIRIGDQSLRPTPAAVAAMGDAVKLLPAFGQAVRGRGRWPDQADAVLRRVQVVLGG